MMNYETIIYKKEEGKGMVTFNRPKKLNALNLKVYEELNSVFRDVEKDPEVKVLILTGTPDLFGAGADIDMLSNLNSSADCYIFTGETSAVYQALENLGKPTVASVGGFCLGGVLELALCCDFRIAADNARFGLPEIKLGVLPGGGGTQRLARLIGMTKAKELVFLGDFIDAQEAYRVGLVNKVVPKEKLNEETDQFAKRLMSRPPFGLRVIKGVMNSGINASLKEGLEIERQGFTVLFSTEDKKEGMAAFLEKRPATFKGR
jgi:enoyl-CoA hydratase